MCLFCRWQYCWNGTVSWKTDFEHEGFHFNNGTSLCSTMWVCLLDWYVYWLSLSCHAPVSCYDHTFSLLHLHTNLILLIFIMMTFQLIFQADTSMACLLCWTPHSFTASCTPQHTHTYPTPNPLPVLKPAIWHKMDVVDRQTPWDTVGVAYEASVTGKAIYISLLRVFTDSDTISCSVWRAFDCEPGTEM